MSLVGNLEDLGLGEILQIVSLSRKSGILSLHSREREGKVVFRQGQVISASSSAYRENLGELLIREGVITLQTLREALSFQEDQQSRQRLGTILIKQFNVSAESIEGCVRQQIEAVAYSLFTWAEGTFDFELREDVETVDDAKMDPLHFMLQQGLNPQFLAMEGSRIIDEQRHRGELPDDGVVAAAESADDNVDFAFDLMSGEPSEAAADQVPPPAQPAAEVVAADERLMLLVDDDEATRDAIAQILGDNGYSVVALSKSEETLIQVDTLWRAGKRPTVMVDLIMPKMDGSGVLGGLELLEILKNNFPDLPVLVMADYRSADAERKVRELGFAYIVKPRKLETADAGVMEAFSGKLIPAICKVESGEKTVEWSDKINIGDELRLEMGDELTPEAPRGPQSTGISMLRGMLEELNNPSLGGGIILLVLRFASEFMNRAVIFIVKKDEISGLGQFGIQDGGNQANQRVRNLRIPRAETSVFTRVIESGLPARLAPDDSVWNARLLATLGDGTPAEIFLGPILSEGKVVAILYGDNLPEARPIADTEALEIFLSQAGLAMEKALLQRRLKGKDQEEL